MGRTTLVDDVERGFAEDADHDPMIDTQETPGKVASPAIDRPSARALYVPSPLPMGELKKALLAEAEDEATAAAPTNRPPPMPPTPAIPIEVSAVPRQTAPGTPPPGLERAIDQRFASFVDGDEARSIGAIVNARAQAIAVARRIKANPAPLPLPALDEFAPIMPVQPIISTDTANAATPKKKGKLATAMLFLVVLLLGGAAIAAALGKLTKANAWKTAAAIRGGAAHVIRAVQSR